MSIFKTMAVRDVTEATQAIPVIDVGPAFRDEPGGRQSVAAQVPGASEHVGFFYIAGHGVPADVVEAAFAASREFHAMPLDDERALRMDLVLDFYNANYFHRRQYAGPTPP